MADIIYHKGDIIRILRDPDLPTGPIQPGLYEVEDDVPAGYLIYIKLIGIEDPVCLALDETLHEIIKVVSSTRPTQRYKQFRNFMVNDLGVNTGTLRGWQEEAARKQVIQFIGKMGLEGKLPGIIDKCITKYVEDQLKDRTFSNTAKNEIRKLAAEELASRFEVTLKYKDEG